MSAHKTESFLTGNTHLGLLLHGGIMALLDTEQPEPEVYANIASIAGALALTCRSAGMMPNRLEYWQAGSATPQGWMATYPVIVAKGHAVANGEECYALAPCPAWLAAMIE